MSYREAKVNAMQLVGAWTAQKKEELKYRAATLVNCVKMVEVVEKIDMAIEHGVTGDNSTREEVEGYGAELDRILLEMTEARKPIGNKRFFPTD